MGHEEEALATDTVQLTDQSTARERMSGKDVRWRMRFVEIHASERDVKRGCLVLGTVALLELVRPTIYGTSLGQMRPP